VQSVWMEGGVQARGSEEWEGQVHLRGLKVRVKE